MSKNPHVDLTILVENLKRYQAGNKEAGLEILKMQEIQRIIGRECTKWIPEYDLNELRQICYHIILRILSKFVLPEDSQGGHILNYINKFLGKRLIDVVDKKNREVSLQSPVGENGLTLEDTLSDPTQDNMEDKIAMKADMAAAIKKLTPNQQKVIYMSFYQDMTHEEIAKELGVSRPAVTMSINAATKKLKEYLS